MLDDELTDLVGDLQHLVHTDPVAEPGLRAIVAPRSVMELLPRRATEPLIRLELEIRGLVHRRARRTDLAHEALPDDPDQRRRHEKRLDAHVEQAEQRRAGIGRMQRGHHQVAGECGLDRDPCGLLVADLADQDHVGVLTHDRLQPGRERDLGLQVDLHLVHRRKDVLDQIFDRHNVQLGAADLRQSGVERRRLARAGRTAALEQAVRFVHDREETLEAVDRHAEIGQLLHRSALVEQTEHRRLAPDRRPCRYAHIDVRSVDDDRELTVL